MKHYLIPESGHFYKANLHTHTTVSDGCKTPAEIKEIYKAHGYSVVAFTDHEVMVDHSDLSDENFLAITSYEVDTGGPALYGDFGEHPCYHLNFYAKNPHETDYPCPNPRYVWGNARAYAEAQDYYKGDYTRVYSAEGQNDMIAEARAKGYLVSYNHPNWSKQSYPDYIGLEGITALEVYAISRVLDYFEATVGPLSFGMVGCSYGGHYTLFTTAAEPRIRSAISSSFFSDRRQYAWPDWTWRDAAALYDDPEIACLCYPRRLCVETGDKDELFAVEYSNASTAEVMDYCAKAGIDPETWFDSIVFPGIHEYNPDPAPVERMIRDLEA